MLDASTLVSMRRDLDRDETTELLREVRERGWLIVMTGHQFVEMLRHENDDEAQRRLEFLVWLSKQPALAWFAAGPSRDSLGMIPHVTAWEARAAAEDVPAADLKRYVLARLFRLSSPPATEFSDLSTLRPIFQERMKREREIASIVRVDGVDFGAETIGQLRRSKTRPKQEAERLILAQAGQLAEELRLGGDKRLSNPESVARDFLSTAADDVPDQVLPGETPADALIRSFGLDPSTIPDEMTSNEFAYLAQFRQQISLAARQVGVDPKRLQEIAIEQIPTCFIQYLLRLARVKSGARASGGDLTDSYLASMAYYVDLVVADKRTVELMSQVRRDPRVGQLGAICRVKRAVDLVQVLSKFGV